MRKDDDVIPPASDMLDAIRNPRRRTISVGPQSEADAYEMMALRERRRRESRSSPDPSTDYPMAATGRPAYLHEKSNPQMAGGGTHASDNVLISTNDDNKTYPFPVLQVEDSLPDTHIDDQDDQALFAKLQVPRVRYDVEVVTKLVVYTGKFRKVYPADVLLTLHRDRAHCRRCCANTVRIMRPFDGHPAVLDSSRRCTGRP